MMERGVSTLTSRRSSGGVGLLLAFALAPAVFPSPFFRTAMGDLIPLLVIAAACIPSARNALRQPWAYPPVLESYDGGHGHVGFQPGHVGVVLKW